MCDDLCTGLVFDSSYIIDETTGEVVDDKSIDWSQSVRAFSYEEYVEKVHHAVMLSDIDRKLMSAIRRVGSSVDAPLWLVNDVFWFLKKVRALKTRSEFKGKPFYPFKDKYLYAVFFVLSLNFGLLSVSSKIASMPCNERGERCYVSRKRGDKEFRKYMKSVRYFMAHLYPDRKGDPLVLLDEAFRKYRVIPDVVYKRAREHAIVMRRQLNGRRPQTIAAAAVVVALGEVMPDNAHHIVSQVCKMFNVSGPSVKSLVKVYHQIVGGVDGVYAARHPTMTPEEDADLSRPWFDLG